MVQLLTDILGPGIIVGYVALAIATLLIMVKPSAFTGIVNGMASIVMALGYSISSVIQITRLKHGYGTEMNHQDLAFATSMVSIAIAFASGSLLSRGIVATHIDGEARDKTTHILYVNIAALAPRKMPPLYMAFCIAAEITCLGLGIYALVLLTALLGSNGFSQKNAVFLAIQGLFIVYTAMASMVDGLQRRRGWTFGFGCILFATSLIFMIWAHATGNVGINFSDWSYGQTFNAAAGIAGFATTVVDWMASDSAVDV